VTETRTNQERIDDVQARIRELWNESHSYTDDEFPSFIRDGGRQASGDFMSAVLTDFDLLPYAISMEEHFSHPSKLAAWIVEEQDRMARRPTPVSS